MPYSVTFNSGIFMTSRIIISLIILLSSSFASQADVVKINTHHPIKHIVVKGDTLWDISAKFLQDPWLWPKVWHNNQQIKNPHLIYPGNIITLCFINGQPMLCVNEQSSDVVHLKPQIHYSASDSKAIATIPLDAIAPFLNSPRVLNKDDLKNAPYIVAFAGEHLIASQANKFYARSILKAEHLKYTTFRAGETYTDPETEEVLGYEAQYIADNSLLRVGDPATLLVTRSLSELRLGDRLMPATTFSLPPNFYPTKPQLKINAFIIATLKGHEKLGQFDIVVLNKGSQSNLKIGHLLDIYQAGKKIQDPFQAEAEIIQLPKEKVGTLLVFRLFERVSYALIMHTSKHVHILDAVQTPE